MHMNEMNETKRLEGGWETKEKRKETKKTRKKEWKHERFDGSLVIE